MNRPLPPAAPPASPRFTGIQLLTDNVDAWSAKRELIQRARRSLDLAYFIVETDGTTCQLMLDLVAAANRGVRVRLLADHFMTFPHAPLLRTLAGVDNIQVRRYRPPAAAFLAALDAAGVDGALFVKGLMTTSKSMLAEAVRGNTLFPVTWAAALQNLTVQARENRIAFALRVLASLRGLVAELAPQDWQDLAERAVAALSRVPRNLGLALEIIAGFKDFLRRAHHKLLLADGCDFIMGGRNLADAYQCRDAGMGRVFQDADLRARDGRPDAPDAHARAFQSLWDDPVSIDIARADPLDDRPALTLAALQDKAGEARGLVPSEPLGRDLPDMDGYLVNNLPAEAGDASITRAYTGLVQDLTRRGAGAVLDIVNAYVFMVDEASDGEALLALRQALGAAARAGVTVNIHTNSLATTDLKPVNVAAYPGLIELIEAGVHVFELDEGQGCLHAKVAAIGGEWLLVGSYNMDPRSQLYDTNNLIVLRDGDGAASAVLREARVAGLAWTPLTAEAARRAAEGAHKALDFGLVRRLL